MEPIGYRAALAPPGAGLYAIQGRRPTMEDETFYAQWRVPTDNPTVPAVSQRVQVFGVLDGHGGADASRFVRRWLPWMLAHHFHPWARDEEIGRQITETFIRMQNFMRSYSDHNRRIFEEQGTTVSMVVQTYRGWYCANAGDSRVVWCRNGRTPTPLSTDHKPSTPSERQRIERLGGHVSTRGGDVARVEPAGLATSRSLGDLESRHTHDGRELPRGTYLVSPVPEVRMVPAAAVGAADFLIVACDGLWDVLSNGEACRVASSASGDPQGAAQQLVRTAYSKGSGDNISVMVVPQSLVEGSVAAEPPPALLNPLTGRPIRWGGPTHRWLLQEVAGKQ